MENNKITNLLPTLVELNVLERYRDGIISTDQNISDSFNDKFNFLVGQVIELELYNGGTIPSIVTKIHEPDENGHNSYDIVFLIGKRNVSVIKNKERYIWRYVPKKFNVKRIKKFIEEINDNTTSKFSEFRKDLFNNYGITFLYSIENNKILTEPLNLDFSLKTVLSEDLKMSQTICTGTNSTSAIESLELLELLEEPKK